MRFVQTSLNGPVIAALTRIERLGPLGLGEGWRVRRQRDRDQVLTHDPVAVPADGSAGRPWAEQIDGFAPPGVA